MRKGKEPDPYLGSGREKKEKDPDPYLGSGRPTSGSDEH
jgi:hypothetical protein